MPGKTLSFIFLLFLVNPVASGQTVQIGVLGLFHPHQVTLSVANGEAIVIHANDSEFVLEAGPRTGIAGIEISGDSLVLNIGGKAVRTKEIDAAGRDGRAAELVLAVPGRLSRRYRGTLAVKAMGGVVVPIVAMDLETAVASVVQAESAPDAPLEALKAQAVVTRSYFAAGRGRHHDFDFCDLTHCQYLREPPKPESAAAIATAATRGLVILFEEKPIAAMFTRSCGGHTRTPAELGIPSNAYAYFSVLCDYCYKNPSRWTRHISEHEAERLLGKGEAGRLEVDRRLGWNAIPSNNFTARKVEGAVILKGAGQGHGIGLCQRGAKAMAEGGAGFREIISHYFPNTALDSLQVSTEPSGARK